MAHGRHFAEKNLLFFHFPNGVDHNFGNFFFFQERYDFGVDQCAGRNKGLPGLRMFHFFDEVFARELFEHTGAHTDAFAVEQHHTHHDLDGIGVRQAFLPALAQLEFFFVFDLLSARFADHTGTAQFLVFTATAFPDPDLKTHIFQPGIDVQIGNREDILKHLFQSLDCAFLGRRPALQKILKRLDLDLDQVGNLNNRWDF